MTKHSWDIAADEARLMRAALARIEHIAGHIVATQEEANVIRGYTPDQARGAIQRIAAEALGYEGR